MVKFWAGPRNPNQWKRLWPLGAAASNVLPTIMMEPDRSMAVMSFKCPLCDMPIESQEKLKQHIKVTHSHYYYDTYLFPPEMLFPGASSSATANVEGVIRDEPLSTQEVTIEQVEEECCTCCAYEESGQGGDCGFCDCEDDAQGECDDCLVM